MADPIEKFNNKPHRFQRWIILLFPAAIAIILLAMSFGMMNAAYATNKAADIPLDTANEISLANQQPFVSGDVAEHFESSTVRHTRSIAWGDYNGDGYLDLAVGNGRFGNKVNYNLLNQVYINDGSGRFTETDIGSEQNDTRGVAWGDWDGDGDLDLAVANYGHLNYVYENNAGQLTLKWMAPISASSTSVAWGDWDGDGDLDLAVGNEGSANQVYQNISDTLQLTWESPLSGALNTSAVAWADWDLDGDLDLSVANMDGSDQIFENISDTLKLDPDNGLGWESPAVAQAKFGFEDCNNNRFWTEPVDPDYEIKTLSLAWGDWDNDGDLDLATGGGSENNDCGAFLRVYENLTGTLSLDDKTGWEWKEKTSKFKPASITWGDWDGDGDLDLAVGNNAGAGWGKQNQIYENVGKTLVLNPPREGWQSHIEPGLYAETTYGIALGDADGDGDLDLAVGNGGRFNGGQANLVMTNEAKVVALDPSPWHSPDMKKSSSAAWGDWDGDGDLDLAVGNVGQPNQIYENVDGVLYFDLAKDLGWQSTVVTDDLTTDIAWGDWDGDGDLDLAVGNDKKHDYVYINQEGTLTLTLDGRLGWVSDYMSSTQSIAWGDWDRDGDLDLAAGHCNIDERDQQPISAFVYENNGDGTMRVDPEQGMGWISPEAICAKDVGWGDWDNDGDLDLALGARVYENDADRLLLNTRAGLGWNGNIDAESVAWGDYDGDGDLDLAVGIWNNKNRVYENIGGSLFFAPNATPALGWTSADIRHTTKLAWGDVDGDKDLDLAVANTSTYGFAPNQIYINDNGVLSNRAVWQTLDNRLLPGGLLYKSQDIAFGDVDSDGDLDLATANHCTQNQCTTPDLPNHVYYNTLQGEELTLAATAPVISIDEPYSTSSADFYASPEVLASPSIPLTYTLRDPQEVPIGRIEVQFSLDGGDNWAPAVPFTGTQTTNLATSASGASHVYNWDTFASNFFGQSDNVVIRMIAYTAPPAAATVLTGTYRYYDGVAGSFQQPFVSDISFPFRVQSTQIKVTDENGNPVEGAVVFRLPAGQVAGAQLMPSPERPLATDNKGFLPGGGELRKGDQLIALRPVDVSKEVTFTNKVRFYHTSAQPTESGLDMFTFEEPGEVTLQVFEENPLLLFDVDMVLEWDARNEPAFQVDLIDGVKRASELLYDVSDGQVALGQVRVFQAKEGWPFADVVVLANNSFRPLAPIGGVTQVPLPETVITRTDTVTGTITGTKIISDAYVNNTIKMGTVWDPFGENSTDLGPDWWQALAHEFAHYLLFLPDDYLGFKDEDSLGKINCQGSFMTSTYDPAFSEFLTEEEWKGACQQSLAERTTGRPDWETIKKFYSVLDIPDAALEGPGNLPLEVTNVYFFDPQETRQTLRARNFEVRDNKPEPERLRLPAAQAYLFQSQGTPDLSDDILIQLGTPTGGGDRLKVRGAFAGDRLCLFDRSRSQAYAGCDDNLQANDISISVAAVDSDWQPQIEVNPVTSRTMQITVTQEITDGASLNVQMFPVHYWSVPGFSGLSPTATMLSDDNIHTQTLDLRLPAYDVSVRVWVNGDPARETIDHFRLNPPWESTIGGPNVGNFGGPNVGNFGGPNVGNFGGPNVGNFGGPNVGNFGGPNVGNFGGPNVGNFGGAQRLT
ncbi:MAG: FG-GAP-like repeat-containing protein, partial [Candidatus Promineifilaceae bacterium]|nr:FG-GAP-like repeat-containing protein [Candidatus Promineifilaceae bacterium]